MAKIKKKNTRRAIWKKTGGICAHCGRAASPKNQTIDHFIPKSWGGTYDNRNLIPTCKDCNWKRKNQEIDPEKYYIYAPQFVIHECLEYERQWNALYCRHEEDNESIAA